MKGLFGTTSYYLAGGVCVAGFVFVLWGPSMFATSYVANTDSNEEEKPSIMEVLGLVEDEGDKPLYLETPEPLKAIYMTQCVVGTPSFREKLLALAEETEINAIIIDVKDYTGYLGFPPESENLKPYWGDHCYAPDMKDFVRKINEKGIYTIARITVFQDPLWTKDHPHLAVQKASDRSIWSDNKGLHFVDVGSKEYWDYIVEISKETHEIGFDELNYDYVRYPSDGPMKNIYYPSSEERVVGDPENGKAEQLRDFFIYLDEETKEYGPTSVDIFGLTTTSMNDLNIGQVLEYALPYFDYVAPMVYPSHYPDGFNGWADPNKVPHEVVEYAMTSAVERAKALQNATTTPQEIRDHVHPLQLRTWIQDFDYGGNYGPEEVRTQIEATYDAGLTSWMVWDPANRYTREALKSE